MIREPVVADMFYPGDPDLLSADIKSYLDDVPPVQEKHPLGLIVPHAGYIFSAPVAAHAYKHLTGRKFKNVVVLAPSHVDGFDGISTYPGEGLRTPLGVVEIDIEARDRLIEQYGVLCSELGFRQEHSLEVQLPFLQKVVQVGWKIIPLVMGYQYKETISLGGDILSNFVNRDAVTIISSDLSHYYPYKRAKELDGRFCSLVESGDRDALWEAYASKAIEACGFGPIFSFLTAIRHKTDVSLEVLDARNSGDTAGPKDQVVGYCSVGCFWRRHANQ